MFAGIKFLARELIMLKNNSDGMEKDGAEYGLYNSSVPVVPHDAVLGGLYPPPPIPMGVYWTLMESDGL